MNCSRRSRLLGRWVKLSKNKDKWYIDFISITKKRLKKSISFLQNDTLSKFYNKFIEKNHKNKKFFHKIDKNNYNFDLRYFVNKEISNLGVKNIENIKIDTFSNNEFFYSYRRSCVNKAKDYGRCISVILMT